MDEYISKEAAVGAGYLSDWYISSVGDESPVWTDEHINELLNDFLVIPKDTPAADVQSVKHGRWIRKHNSFPQRYFCTECGGGDVGRFAFCHYCGARMDGEK